MRLILLLFVAALLTLGALAENKASILNPQIRPLQKAKHARDGHKPSGARSILNPVVRTTDNFIDQRCVSLSFDAVVDAPCLQCSRTIKDPVTGLDRPLKSGDLLHIQFWLEITPDETCKPSPDVPDSSSNDQIVTNDCLVTKFHAVVGSGDQCTYLGSPTGVYHTADSPLYTIHNGDHRSVHLVSDNGNFEITLIFKGIYNNTLWPSEAFAHRHYLQTTTIGTAPNLITYEAQFAALCYDHNLCPGATYVPPAPPAPPALPPARYTWISKKFTERLIDHAHYHPCSEETTHLQKGCNEIHAVPAPVPT